MTSNDMKTLKRILDINAPPGEVWRVLTDPELVREWAAAYGEGVSIRTTWREGDPVAWRAADGATRAGGRIAAFQPQRLLRFEYDKGDLGAGRPYADSYAISETGEGARLEFTSGPFDDEKAPAIEAQVLLAVAEIKSLAEESAQIRRLRA